MRKILFFLILMFLISDNIKVQAATYSSEPIDIKQPNGDTIKARFYGDEFLSWAETLDGYTIAINPSDGYWYFAQRGVKGNLVASLHQVGKIDPMNIGLVQHLRPSQEIIDQAEQKRAEFNASLMIRSKTGTKKLGVILIEFPDEPGGSYSNENYEVLFFSESYYNTRNNDIRSPDLEEVFGSIKDYYLEVSYGQESITGDIVNTNSGGSYQWLMADTNKTYYWDSNLPSDIMIIEAIDKARSAHQNNPEEFKDPDAYDMICVYYAGNEYGEALWYHVGTTNGYDHAYIAPEKYNHKFGHVGPHCHEIGHLLGITDKYTTEREAGCYGVMGDGNWNGPQPPGRNGQCPAHITAVGKIQLGWVTPNIINSNTLVTLDPIENDSTSVYKIISDNTTGYSYYIFENRTTSHQFSSFDQYLPGRGDCSGGLLIWRLDSQSLMHESFVPADNDFQVGVTDGGDYFPGTTDNTELTGITTPSSNFGINFDLASGLAVNNIIKGFDLNDPYIDCDLIVNKWSGKIRTSLSWDDQIEVIGNVFVHVDSGGVTTGVVIKTDHLFDQKQTKISSIIDNKKFEQAVTDDVILTIVEGSIVNLNGNYVKSSGTLGGILNRENNVTFNPDIQLLENGTDLIGQYSTIQEALADAQNGDKIIVNSDIILTSSLDITGDITIELINNHFIKTQPGIITRGPNVVFIPDIRLLGHTSIVGQYATIHRALDDAESQENSVEVHSDITLTANVAVIDDVTLTFKQGITVYLDEYTIKANGGLIIIEENVTFIPDIRLLRNCTTLFGLYPSYSSALADYEAGDCIIFEGYTINVDSLDITGIAKYYNDNELPDAELLVNYDGGVGSDTTDIYGEYFFDNIYPGDAILSINKEDDLQGAITGSDALLLLRYLAFLATLTEDQKFAADVTEDGDVTGSDAQALLRYLAFYTDGIGSTGQWRFSPEDSSFFHVTNDYIDFKGFLLGDVNGDWSPSTKSGDSSSTLAELELTFNASKALTGDIIEIPITIKNVQEALYTFLLSVEYNDQYLQYYDVQTTALTKQFESAFNGTKSGVVHIAMAGIEGVKNDGEILRLQFKSTKSMPSETEMALEFTRAIINDYVIVNKYDGENGLNKKEEQVTDELPKIQLPQQFSLAQNHPNPFNSTTTIQYQLPEDCPVNLVIYNMLGQKIKTLVNNEHRTAGVHQVSWDGRDDLGRSVSSGVFVYRFTAGNFVASRKLVVMK